MEIATANTGGGFKLAPAGSHRAVCYRFIDLGTQETEFQGETKHQHKIMLSFELVDEIDEFEYDGKTIQAPFSIHRTFTWSMSEKGHLRPFLEQWRGRGFTDADFKPGGFDTQKLIGVPLLLNVTHNERNGKTYANASAASPLPKAMQGDIPRLHNETIYLALQKDRWDATAFDKLSDNVKAKIEASPEFRRLHGMDDDPSKPVEDFTSENLDDDIPF